MNAQTALSVYLEKLYTVHRLRGVAESTKSKYRIAIRHLGRHLDREPLVGDLNDTAVSGCLAAVEASGASPGTVNGYRAKLLCLADYAVRKGLLRESLDIPKLKEYRREPESLSEETFSAVMQAAENVSGRVGKVPASLWWSALLLALYDSAARVSAMLSVQWCDVDLEAGSLLIRAERQKQKSDQRHPLHSDTVALLRRLRDITGGSGSVWPWPYCSGYLWQLFARKIAKPAGLPANRRFKFHAIRRTSLSLVAAELGVSAATTLADHSSEAVTRKSYIDKSRLGGRRPIDVLPRPGKQKWTGWLGWLRRRRSR